MLNNFQTTFDLSKNQYRMVLIYCAAFVVQSGALLFLSPEKFKINIFIILLAFNMIYKIMWLKFFSD
jgi:hypothetical protein